MSTLLISIVTAGFPAIVEVDATQNGCPISNASTQPPGFVLQQQLGVPNTVFSGNSWDVCLPLDIGGRTYLGLFFEAEMLYAATNSRIVRNGDRIRIDYVRDSAFDLDGRDRRIGFARFTLQPLPVGRYSLEYWRREQIAPVSSLRLQGEFEVNVVAGIAPIPVPMIQPWSLGLLALMFGVAGLTALRRPPE